MKKFATLLLPVLICFVASAQSIQPDPPYKKLGVLPAMGLLGFDSSTIITLNTLPKDMPVLVVCFSTTCDHCQAEAKEIVKNKDKFKKIRVVFLTPEKLPNIKQFYDEYKLSELKNVVVGKDYRFFAPSFYTFKNFPFTVLYNKKHEYLNSFEGTTPTAVILEEFKKQKAL